MVIQHIHQYLNINKQQSMKDYAPAFPNQGFSRFVKRINLSPEQLNPFPVYPVLQEHLNDPGELEQSAFWSQGAPKHSSIST